MSRQIDFDKKLSDEDKEWLHEWSLDHLIEANNRRFDKDYQNEEGPEIEFDENRAPNPPREPANFATDQVLTGPAYPAKAPSHTETQQPYGQISVSAQSDDALEKDVAQLSVDDLKKELKDLGQPVSGNQKELRERLVKALKDPKE